MSFSKKITSIVSIAVLFSILLSFYASAAVTRCYARPGDPPVIQMDIPFDITVNSGVLTPGTELARGASAPAGMFCDFTGSFESGENGIYFRNDFPATTKALLLNSGVEITQRATIGGSGVTLTITNPTVPDLFLGRWDQNPSGGDLNISSRYTFTVNKGANSLKPFDTGMVLLGTHVNYQGQNLGVPVYVRIAGNLTLLCPSPTVGVTASNGGSVGFGTVTPKQMNDGDAINSSFNLNMAVSEDCETGLNISVRFEPNNNTILGDKYLDMGNGLQTVLNNHSTDINYNQTYAVGEILPRVPKSIPYTATLTKIPGSTVTSGSFSKTIRVVVSY